MARYHPYMASANTGLTNSSRDFQKVYLPMTDVPESSFAKVKQSENITLERNTLGIMSLHSPPLIETEYSDFIEYEIKTEHWTRLSSYSHRFKMSFQNGREHPQYLAIKSTSSRKLAASDLLQEPFFLLKLFKLINISINGVLISNTEENENVVQRAISAMLSCDTPEKKKLAAPFGLPYARYANNSTMNLSDRYSNNYTDFWQVKGDSGFERHMDKFYGQPIPTEDHRCYYYYDLPLWLICPFFNSNAMLPPGLTIKIQIQPQEPGRIILGTDVPADERDINTFNLTGVAYEPNAISCRQYLFTEEYLKKLDSLRKVKPQQIVSSRLENRRLLYNQTSYLTQEDIYTTFEIQLNNQIPQNLIIAHMSKIDFYVNAAPRVQLTNQGASQFGISEPYYFPSGLSLDTLRVSINNSIMYAGDSHKRAISSSAIEELNEKFYQEMDERRPTNNMPRSLYSINKFWQIPMLKPGKNYSSDQAISMQLSFYPRRTSFPYILFTNDWQTMTVPYFDVFLKLLQSFSIAYDGTVSKDSFNEPSNNYHSVYFQ